MFNLLKTAVLMAAITALFMAVGAFMGGQQGMMFALVVAVGLNFFSYWFSDKLVLKMYNAREVDETSAPQFHSMIAELAQKAGLPMPRVYVIDEAAPNAFATGRNPEHAAVAATTGILQVLTERELRAVMAHELTHVLHRDILISTISATMAGAISMLANFAMFFGGRDSEGPAGQPDRRPGGGAARAARGEPDPDGDQPGARVRGRSRRRRDLRRPARARLGAREDPRLRARHAARRRRAQPGDGADDDHQPAPRRRPDDAVLDPSVDRGARRPAAGDGGGAAALSGGGPGAGLNFAAARPK